MLGIMHRAQEERDDRERQHRISAWREDVARKYDVPPNLEDCHRDFCLAILKKLPPDRVSQALVDLEHSIVLRARQTLRCRIFGCKPRSLCELHPYCTDCQGRCTRCGISIVPSATSRIS